MFTAKFGPGDKIFAKMRGYPPWPARVEGVADETANKTKYQVYFFGTGHSAVLKQNELLPYVENRDKYGKLMKNKSFNKAIFEIQSELGLRKKSVEEEGLRTKTGQRKADVGDTEQSAKKFQNKSEVKSDENSPDPSKMPASSSAFVSRSGRKIKPKNLFLSLDDQKMEQVGTPKCTKNMGKMAKPKVSARRNYVDFDSELLKNGILTASTPKGEDVRLQLNFNKPVVFESEKASLEWKTKVLEVGKTIKAQIESGEILPESVKKEIDKKYQEQLGQLERKMAFNDKREQLEYLKMEAEILDLDARIKSSLSLKQADLESCLKCLDELSAININLCMVKKHPEVVDTIIKLKKYVGNTSYWNMIDKESKKFAFKAASIRSKSDHLFNTIKSLFTVAPYDKQFWDDFAEGLKERNS